MFDNIFIAVLIMLMCFIYFGGMIDNKTFYILVTGLVLWFVYYQYFCTNRSKTTNEGFDAILGDKKRGIVRRIDLEDFFNFVEWFQVSDLDPDLDYTENTYDQVLPTHYVKGASCAIDGEALIIRQSIQNILDNLHYVVNINDKDNFYSRFLVAKVGSNLQFDRDHPRFHKANYDEMVRNKISGQFTITPQNEFDLYLPRPNLDSENQNPVPLTINLHNYYNLKNTEVNLLALKMIFDIVQENNTGVLTSIVRPTEHPAFEQEFMVPLKSVINSMLTIADTDIFKEYLHEQKFKLKYRGLVFNPDMIKL